MQKKKLADVIKEARKNKNISQRELARQINVDNSSIAKIEKGLILKPTEFILMKIAKSLDLDVINLLKLAGYDEKDINIFNKLTETNIDSYFDDAPLHEVKQMLDRLDLEIRATYNLKTAMENYNFDNLKKLPNLDKKEKNKLVEDWKEQINQHKFKIDSLKNASKKLETIFNTRKDNGEVVEESDKDITDIIEKFLQQVENK